CQHHDNSPFTF
nr:immunoglobulin light chain junction region [Macaca mulatta]